MRSRPEVERDARLVADHPRVVSRRGLERIPRSDLDLDAIGAENDHPAGHDVADVRRRRVACERSCVNRPAPARAVDPVADGHARERNLTPAALVEEDLRLLGRVKALCDHVAHAHDGPTDGAAMLAAIDGDLTEDAVRWLRRSQRAGALVDALAAIGMAVPALYGPTLRFDQEFRRERPEFSYALRTGAPLMAGWAVLLLWADRKPLQRRGVLAITVAPVIAGLMANDAHAVASGRLSRVSAAPVRTLQVGLTALFGYSLARAHAFVRATDRQA
jgi:hypothetical protein